MPRPVRSLLLAVLGLTLLGACRSAPTLTKISEVSVVKSRFNNDAGKPRIILLLSPT